MHQKELPKQLQSFILIDMFCTLAQQRAHMVVSKRIVHRFSFPAAPYQVCILEYSQLMADGGLCHPEQGSNITDTDFLFEQDIQDADPCPISKYPKQVGQSVQRLVIPPSAAIRALSVHDDIFSVIQFPVSFIHRR